MSLMENQSLASREQCMSKSGKNILLIMTLLLLTSCTSAEHSEALRIYQLAKTTQNLEQLTHALSTLAKLAPEQYQAEFAKAEQAKTFLAQAQSHQAEKNDYATYLASHTSYRSLPSTAAKNILISSGASLFPLLKAKISIDNSFQFRPEHLAQLFQKYSELPISDWNLVEVNTTVEQLSRAIKALNTALDLVQPNTHIAEMELWQSAITEQINMVTHARDYLANLALYHSARKLEILNEELSNESIKLLSLVRQKLAEEAMQPAFLKAINQYAPFQSLIVNISFATNLSVKDKHAGWYQHWHMLELTTLEPIGEFKNYPVNKQHRNKQLATFLAANKISIPVLAHEFSNKSYFYQRFPAIIALTEKLKIDNALLI